MVRIKRRNLRRFANIKSQRRLSLNDSILSDQLESFDENNSTISNIENLSNEIFYEIFDYLDGYDVYKSFSNLNNRFEDLLINGSFLLKINFSVKTILDDRYQQFIKSNKDHILSFHSSNEFFLERFISSCVIDSTFHRLESFVFDEISPLKLLVYLFHLRTLPRLYSLSIRLNDYYDDLVDIYQILFRFPVLKYLKWEIMDEQEVEITTPIATEGQFSPIEYFISHFWFTLNELTDLLSYTPRLTHLSCPNIVESNENFNTNVLKNLTNLVYLKLTIIDLDFEHFEQFLLNICSSLNYLNISIQSSNKIYLDGDRWERLISEHMPLLTKFFFSYHDSIYDDFEGDPYHSFINRFKSSFWIERKWLLRIVITNHDIRYEISPSLSLSDTQLYLSSRHYPVKKSQLFVNKLNSLFQTIDITYMDVKCHQISADILISIFNLLPNLNTICLTDLPSYENIQKSDPDMNAFNQFIKNNKITKLTLENISNLQQIDLIINAFPRVQYFTLQNFVNINFESAIKRILLKIKEKKIFHPMTLCFVAAEIEYDKLDELKEMIDSKNLLKDYTINRQLNRFYLQWK